VRIYIYIYIVCMYRICVLERLEDFYMKDSSFR
jgi:hypothetical protein